MPGWEYCRAIVYHQRIEYLTPEGPRREDIRDGPTESRGTRILQRIARLGLDGWEMIAADHDGGRPDYGVYLFKRPLP